MNRKEFLQASALLVPASMMGIGKAEASSVAPAAAAPASYLDSEGFRKNARALKFNADGKFKIVQFTDVHWAPGNAASEVAAERIAEAGAWLDGFDPDPLLRACAGE